MLASARAPRPCVKFCTRGRDCGWKNHPPRIRPPSRAGTRPRERCCGRVNIMIAASSCVRLPQFITRGHKATRLNRGGGRARRVQTGRMGYQWGGCAARIHLAAGAPARATRERFYGKIFSSRSRRWLGHCANLDTAVFKEDYVRSRRPNNRFAN